MEIIFEKLKKIAVLAEQGSPNEKEAAMDLLKKLLKKHNLSIECLTDNTKKKRCFTTSSGNTIAVLLMCVFKIVGAERSKEMYGYKGERNKFYIDLTDFEFVELNNLYNFNKKKH
jgi:hypothetical protein